MIQFELVKVILQFKKDINILRKAPSYEIQYRFDEIWQLDKDMALKFLFYVRDIRHGLGERRIFRICLLSIIDHLDAGIFDNIIKYGRYDDLFIFFDTCLHNKLLEYLKIQLQRDISNYNDKGKISLLAKWLPSINCSSYQSRRLANTLISYIGITAKQYRKMLSKLRERLNIVERKCSTNNWQKINYSTIPNSADKLYSKAFLKHDYKRRIKHLNTAPKVQLHKPIEFLIDNYAEINLKPVL